MCSSPMPAMTVSWVSGSNVTVNVLSSSVTRTSCSLSLSSSFLLPAEIASSAERKALFACFVVLMGVMLMAASVMHLVEKVIPDLDHVLLALLFACPAANVVATVAGALSGSDMAHGIQTLRQTLAWTGLCVSFTLLGMSSIVEAVEIPIFELTFKVNPVVLTSVGLNALCLLSYFSSVVDMEMPMLDDRNALLGSEMKPLVMKRLK